MLRRLMLGVVPALAALAAHAIPAPAGVAPRLHPPGASAPAFMLAARGVQVYQCTPAPVSGDYGWFLVAPDATLYDGDRSAASLRSPHAWQSLDDLSSASGVPVALQAAGAGNLPWALLAASALGSSGLFAGVTSVQRVNTEGGAPPAGGCDAANAGAEARVAFRADYYFYKAAG